jgi:hypothetical protein
VTVAYSIRKESEMLASELGNIKVGDFVWSESQERMSRCVRSILDDHGKPFVEIAPVEYGEMWRTTILTEDCPMKWDNLTHYQSWEVDQYGNLVPDCLVVLPNDLIALGCKAEDILKLDWFEPRDKDMTVWIFVNHNRLQEIAAVSDGLIQSPADVQVDASLGFMRISHKHKRYNWTDGFYALDIDERQWAIAAQYNLHYPLGNTDLAQEE